MYFKYFQECAAAESFEKIWAKGLEQHDFLDKSSLFHRVARKDSRSLMNVTFGTGSDKVDAAFVKTTEQHGIVSIKGHRAVGGIRASIYNAMPLEGVNYLVDFMIEFEKHYYRNS